MPVKKNLEIYFHRMAGEGGQKNHGDESNNTSCFKFKSHLRLVYNL